MFFFLGFFEIERKKIYIYIFFFFFFFAIFDIWTILIKSHVSENEKKKNMWVFQTIFFFCSKNTTNVVFDDTFHENVKN